MTSQEQVASEGGSNLPPFFINPQVITLESHAHAKLRTHIPMTSVNNSNCVPLTLADIPEAAKHYPIVFTQGKSPMLMAIVGLEKKNYYMNDDGKWTEHCYIPSYVRKYPFVFMETPEGQLVMCVDAPALIFDEDAEGAPLYKDGQPSELSKSALEFCAAYQTQHQLTLEFCDLMQKKEMLASHSSSIELANGRTVNLDGFQMIDLDKLRTLSQAEVFDWYKREYIAHIHYILQSVTNWKNLLDLANKDEPKQDVVK